MPPPPIRHLRASPPPSVRGSGGAAGADPISQAWGSDYPPTQRQRARMTRTIGSGAARGPGGDTALATGGYRARQAAGRGKAAREQARRIRSGANGRRRMAGLAAHPPPRASSLPALDGAGQATMTAGQLATVLCALSAKDPAPGVFVFTHPGLDPRTPEHAVTPRQHDRGFIFSLPGLPPPDFVPRQGSADLSDLSLSDTTLSASSLSYSSPSEGSSAPISPAKPIPIPPMRPPWAEGACAHGRGGFCFGCWTEMGSPHLPNPDADPDPDPERDGPGRPSTFPRSAMKRAEAGTMRRKVSFAEGEDIAATWGAEDLPRGFGVPVSLPAPAGKDGGDSCSLSSESSSEDETPSRGRNGGKARLRGLEVVGAVLGKLRAIPRRGTI